MTIESYVKGAFLLSVMQSYSDKENLRDYLLIYSPAPTDRFHHVKLKDAASFTMILLEAGLAGKLLWAWKYIVSSP